MRLRIRRAKIVDDLRQQFEVYGADLVWLAPRADLGHRRQRAAAQAFPGCIG
jgi:hypothetical protein